MRQSYGYLSRFSAMSLASLLRNLPSLSASPVNRLIEYSRAAPSILITAKPFTACALPRRRSV